MKNRLFFVMGWLFTVLGALVLFCSPKIVFPGLEHILGIEMIVGRGNVSYQSDGSYVFTNPGAMAAWILSVAGVGLLMAASGVIMLYFTCCKL